MFHYPLKMQSGAQGIVEPMRLFWFAAVLLTLCSVVSCSSEIPIAAEQLEWAEYNGAIHHEPDEWDRFDGDDLAGYTTPGERTDTRVWRKYRSEQSALEAINQIEKISFATDWQPLWKVCQGTSVSIAFMHPQREDVGLYGYITPTESGIEILLSASFSPSPPNEKGYETRRLHDGPTVQADSLLSCHKDS